MCLLLLTFLYKTTEKKLVETKEYVYFIDVKDCLSIKLIRSVKCFVNVLVFLYELCK